MIVVGDFEIEDKIIYSLVTELSYLENPTSEDITIQAKSVLLGNIFHTVQLRGDEIFGKCIT